MTDFVFIDKATEADPIPIATDLVGGIEFPYAKLVDPTPGSVAPIGVPAHPMSVTDAAAATEATLALIKAALDALSAKVAACDTGDVTLDAATIAALQTISVTGAATETTLSSINTKLPALSAGRIPVVLPAGGGGLTDTELRAEAVGVEDGELVSALKALTRALKPFNVRTFGGSNRLSVDVNNIVAGAITATFAANQDLRTMTTLTNQVNVAGYNAFALLKAQSRMAYNTGVRPLI